MKISKKIKNRSQKKKLKNKSLKKYGGAEPTASTAATKNEKYRKEALAAAPTVGTITAAAIAGFLAPYSTLAAVGT